MLCVTRITVRDHQLLARSNSEHQRGVNTASLINRDRFGRNLELQIFEVVFNRQKGIGQPAALVNQKPL